MAKYCGKVNSIGAYTTIVTNVTNEDIHGNRTPGGGNIERYIDGIQIGAKTFGKTSCAVNLYEHLEAGKDACVYTFLHPFIGFPPIRPGIIGISYPGERKAFVMTAKQLTHSLLMLALLPLLWLIPGIIVGAILGSILGGSEYISAGITILVALSPWMAAVQLFMNFNRMKSELGLENISVVSAV